MGTVIGLTLKDDGKPGDKKPGDKKSEDKKPEK